MSEKKKSAARRAGAEDIDVFEAYEKKRKKPKKKAGASAKASSAKAKSRKKKKKAGSWWVWPVTVVMIVILAGLGVTAMREKQQYEQFTLMREAVDVSGFYPGIAVDGRDVTGRSLNEVLYEEAARDQAFRDNLSVTLACGSRTWTITANDLNYRSDYEKAVQSAWQLGHEGGVAQRYEAIRQVRQNGASFNVTRTWDTDRLRAMADAVSAELTVPAQDAQVIAFDTATHEFQFAQEQNGTYVDAEQVYQAALAALNSGTGGQTVTIRQEPVYPTETLAELQPKMGLMASARTFVAGSRERRNNVILALNILDGMRLEPKEIFTFNGTLGERREEDGFKMAGAFLDGLMTEEVGGGICQVSTTLFNAVAKSDLELIARSPHSRPVDYVDKGKDAAVSWPNQDLKFQNDTPYPVYIATEYNAETRWCTVALYGQMLPNGTYITIEAVTVEEYEPGDDIYIYTTDLPTGQKEKIEGARPGYYCESYKIYHSADGTELSRELYCRSSYAASGAKYRVGQ